MLVLGLGKVLVRVSRKPSETLTLGVQGSILFVLRISGLELGWFGSFHSVSWELL